MKTIIVAAIALVAMSFTRSTLKTSAPARAITAFGDWDEVGDKALDFTTGNETILFPSISKDYNQLKIRVTEGTLRVFDVKLYYDDGEFQTITMNQNFRDGGESRTLELTAPGHALVKFEFTYDVNVSDRGHKARLTVLCRNKVKKS